MATRYVSPTGATPGGYDAYYTALGTAIAALVDGDVIILEKSTAHTLANAQYQHNQKSFTIRNEDNDDDYASCVVNVSGGAEIYLRSAIDVGMRVLIKGITFSGELNSAVYSGASNNYALFRLTAVQVNMQVTLDHCRICHIERTVAVPLLSGIVYMSPAAGSSETYLRIQHCEFDHLYGPLTSDENGLRRIWMFNGGVQYVNDCSFHDCGELWGRTGNGGVQTTAVNETAFFYRCTWERVYATSYTNQANDAPDGGSMYVNTVPAATTVWAYLYDCTWTDMQAGKGGGIWCGGDANMEVHRGKFTRCKTTCPTYGGGASGRGGQSDSANLGVSKFLDCLFEDCSTTGNGGALRTVPFNPQLQIYNCTFTGNSCGDDKNGEDVFVSGLTSAYITQKALISNNVFADAGVRVYGESNLGIATASNNYAPDGAAAIVDTGATITGTISAAPLLGSDYKPASGSSLLNAGTAVTGRQWARDLAGRYRRRPATPTVGCYETAARVAVIDRV